MSVLYDCPRVKFCVSVRSADRVELHHEGNGSSAPHCSVGSLRHHHLRHHRSRALHRTHAQDLLLYRNRYTYFNVLKFKIFKEISN